MSAATGIVGPGAGVRAMSIRVTRGRLVVAVLVVWIVAWRLFKGRDTLSLADSDVTSLHTWLNRLNDNVTTNRNSNPFFVYFINVIEVGAAHLISWFEQAIAQPANGRPLPLIGWLGVVAIATFVSTVFGNWKVGLLALLGFVFIGLQGLFQPAMDTMALIIAAVLVALIIGIPLGILAGVSDATNRIVTPLLDVMQTMPPYVYLPLITLLFLIGPAAGVIATLIYAIPPVVRLSAHGIRGVPGTTLEAAQSMGTTKLQLLRTVLIPMAMRTIAIGINQTMMAALSMVTIAALVDAPGLGQVIITALESQDVGSAFNAGLALVIIGIVLDRVTTAASERLGPAMRPVSATRTNARRALIAAGAVAMLVLIYESYTFQWAASFPSRLGSMSLDIGSPLQHGATDVSNWAQAHLFTVTNGIKNAVTYHALNPLQSLLEDTPWYFTFAAIVALAAILGGLGATLTATVCLGLIIGTGLWGDSMETLAATLIATVLVMAAGVVLGVWMGRSARVDGVIRPILDAAQVMPAFVYLVPFVALFAASRFTGIIAAIFYGAPVAIKIVADGIRGVSETTVEAATAAGSSTWQVITKVQLPMSIRTLALATNQGLIYVLAMVVVGGLVGGGALGSDVVTGFSQSSVYGKGLAAGAAIVLLGIMLDRTTQAAARRVDASERLVS